MSQPTQNQDDRLPQIASYRLTQFLYEGSRTRVYRGVRWADEQPVVLKWLKGEFPSIHDLLRLRNHYTIAKNLPGPGITQPLGLEAYQHGFVLVMPDEGYQSLSDYLTEQPLDLAEVLAIALQLADILHILYQHRVIHKDIKPANILIHPETLQIQLTDFSIASLLPRETEDVKHPNVLEGTLAYLAPEQTGRMNRGIDYRTDFYALGVTLFELLTGQLPFQSEDPLELVHGHLAQPVPSISDIQPEVPTVIGAIVAKLMAKNAEGRYQSALGLKHDLEVALTQLQTTGTVATFALATRDLSDRFLIPEKLYGREPEVQALLAAFERVAGTSSLPPSRSELLLIAGYSGIGKTALVNEVHKPIARQQGYFIKGKFDQFNRNVPFSGFVQALRDLMGQLLSESDAQLAQWQAQILAALGEDGQVLIDVIPELEQIIGPQPPVIDLAGGAAQTRFRLLFQHFLQVFAKPTHPLVIFLDDLQWVDSASLQLIQVLMDTQALGNLLLIGAYRDNEVSPGHPLILTLNGLVQAGAAVNTLTLGPLTFADLNQWVADTLSCPPELATPLSQLIAQKTQGNPFFTAQFLKALHQDGLITFDIQARYWQCDITRVREAALTDDVVQFMAQQLQKLPPATQQGLKVAACIGNRFDLETLAIAANQSPGAAAAVLWPALQAGLVLPQSEIYKFYTVTGLQVPDTAPFAVNTSPLLQYKFLHDRVQQAAYSLIPEAERAIAHYQIGQYLLQQVSSAAQADRIFELVNQLNYGLTLMTDSAERTHLAQLNLMAARKARQATAYQAARDYGLTGIDLLGDAGWPSHYATTLALHELVADVTSLLGEFDSMEHWIEQVMHQATTPLDQINVYQVKIQALNARNEFVAAIATGRAVLQQLGVSFPDQPTPEDVAQAHAEIAALIGDRAIADLAQLPPMTDPQQLAIVQIAASIMSSCYLTNAPIYPLVIALQVQCSIQFGNTVFSPSAYVSYAFQLSLRWRDVAIAQQFGQLAYRLASEPEFKMIRAATTVVMGGYVYHRTGALRETLPIFQEGYQAGLETGNLEFVLYNIQVFALAAFWCGLPLAEVESQIQAYHQQLLDLNQVTTAKHYLIYWEAAQVLLGHDEAEVPFRQATYQQSLIAEVAISQDAFRLGIFYLHRFFLNFLLADLAQAEADAAQARQHLAAYSSTVAEPVFYFYDSLVALATLPAEATAADPKLQRVQSNQALLQRWADSAPMNYRHKWDLVEAERCAIAGDRVGAMDGYDRAIAGAKAQRFLQDEALAHERAALFYQTWGQEKIARVYLTDAYYIYAHWGARAKTDQLAEQYPQLLASIARSPTEALPSLTNTTLVPSHNLDLAAVLKASQAISETIVLKQLLTRLMQVILENAGATKGALVLPQAERLTVVAIAIHAALPETRLPFVPLEDCQEIPHTVINSVRRCQGDCILDDPQADPTVAADPYWHSHAPGSVLCVPLLKQGALMGILYLENQLTEHAFSCERLEVLKLLCTQAAISLENAQLYQQSQTYAQQLEQSLTQLQASEIRFRSLATNIPGMIYQMRTTADDGWSVTYASSGCYDLYEVSAEEMMSGQCSFRDFEHPEDRSRVDQQVAKPITHPQYIELEFRIITRSGKVKWIQVGTQAIPQPDGSVTWDGVVIDVSDRKAAEAQLQQQAQQLESANRQLAEYSQTLEQRVEVRTQELIQSEKMAALGQLTASIAHEINTPLGVIRAAAANIAAGFQTSIAQLPTLWPQLSPDQQQAFLQLVQTALDRPHALSTRAERELRRHLQTELAAQGIEAAAAIATQLTLLRLGPDLTPYRLILQAPNCKDLLQAAYQLVLQGQSTTSIQQEVDRAAKIVFALKTYSYQGRDSDCSLVSLTDSIDLALTLYHNRLKHDIQVIRRYDNELPDLLCKPDELTQVWVNLIDNALYAMGAQGMLEIAVFQQDDQLVVELTDSGSGIAPELQAQIFEPFFTTKPRGEGSGLGLDIVRQIVQSHGGQITVQSQPGRTAFTVCLPIAHNYQALA